MSFKLPSRRLNVADNFCRRHVYHDLQPYVCAFKDCEKQEQLFGSRHKWFDHELAMHRREWVCPGHCDDVFSSQPDFKGHIAINYANLGSISSLSTLIKTCERPILPSASVECPFCLEKVASRKKIRKHIGQHQLDLSLRALPISVAGAGFSDSDGDSDGDSTDSDNTIVGDVTGGKHQATTTQKENHNGEQETKTQLLKDFIRRVEDWKNLNVDQFGKFLQHGVYEVSTDVDIPGKIVSLHTQYSVYIGKHLGSSSYELVPDASSPTVHNTLHWRCLT